MLNPRSCGLVRRGDTALAAGPNWWRCSGAAHVIVAQRMQARVDAEISGHLRVAVGDAVEIAVSPVVGDVGEREGVVIERGVEFGAAALCALLVVGQDRDGVRIEAEDAQLVCFGVFDSHRAILADQVAPDGQQSGGQDEVFPGEPERLAASCAGDEGQPGEVRFIPVLVLTVGRLLGRRARARRLIAQWAGRRRGRAACHGRSR